ncbi:MAG: DUF1573 domain-containing protein [Bacteroidota bacterium]
MIKQAFIPFLVSVFIVFQGCSGADDGAKEEQKQTQDAARISFESLEHDFGTLKYRESAMYDFVFTNTGEDPLILERVKATCGCTASDWTKEPVKKGDTGTISVKYSATSLGNFNKSIMVYSNTAEPVRLIIKGTVERAAAAEG